MAVFMLNICKFDDCGITFPSLADLILHIEDTHIDYDPAVIEAKEQQQPQCLPLSYVLKFYSNSSRRETQLVDIKKRLIQHATKNLSSAHMESDEEDLISESEDSNESWVTPKEFSSEYILKHGSKMTSPSTSAVNSEKPFECPVPGCKKRYKNLNGIKYHSKNGHKNDGKMRKRYKCHCKKSYKTAQRLKNHLNSCHTNSCLVIVDSNEVQTEIRGGSTIRHTDPKTLEALRFKTINNISIAQNRVARDLGILTPEISPHSSPNSVYFLPRISAEF